MDRRLTDGALIGPSINNGTTGGTVDLPPHQKQVLLHGSDFGLELANRFEDFLDLPIDGQALRRILLPGFIGQNAQAAIQSIDIFFFPPDPQV